MPWRGYTHFQQQVQNGHSGSDVKETYFSWFKDRFIGNTHWKLVKTVINVRN